MYKYLLVSALFAASAFCSGDDESGDPTRNPIYKYRYQKEDLMQTAASSIPVRGYHVVEGGYYPSDIGGIGGGNIGGGGGGFGYGGYEPNFGGGLHRGGFGLGLRGAGIGGGYHQSLGGIGGLGYGGYHGGGVGQYISPIYNQGYGGGEVIDKNAYSGEKKNLNDESYEKASGKKGEEINHGKEGYSQGVNAVKNNKGESGYYNDQQSGKKLAEDGKSYHSGQQFDQQGKNVGEHNQKSGHKKGHIIKGFKSSHHKDESKKTEEFYDEENDEAGKFNFKGESGSFGEKGESNVKGGHENGVAASGEQKKEGHYEKAEIVDNSNADKGQYGEKKYAGSGSIYGVNNGVDQQSLLGHQESSRYYKKHPYHVPFY